MNGAAERTEIAGSRSRERACAVPRRTGVHVLLVLVVLAGLGPGFVGGRSACAQERPNLLLLSIDTLRADHVSSHGYPRPTTPTLDEIARNGTRLARAKSVAPWTLPSFATTFTGRHPTRHGAGAVGPVRDIGAQPPRILSPTVPTLGEVLRDAGYRTHAVTSNPYLKLGPLRGFEPYVCKAVRADRIGALTREWIAREVDDVGPWALWVHFNDPHEPTLAADAYLRQIGVGPEVIGDPHRGDLVRWGDREKGTHLGNRASESEALDLLRIKIALYDATIRQVDTEIARILEALQRHGELRDTLVVVWSDHGEEFLDHAEEGAAWRHDPRGIWGIGHGHTLFEEQLHVPWILMGPGVAANRVIDEQISLVDFMPTVLGLLDLGAPAGMDGVDRGPWMADRQRRDLPAPAEALAYGPDWMAWSDGRWKLVTDRLGVPKLLYDLENDPFELHDRVAALDSLPAALAVRDTLLGWAEAMLDDAPPPTDPGQLTDEMREGLRSLGYVQ